MRIGDVIGRVTLAKWHPSLAGARWLLVAPLSHAGLLDDETGRGEPLVMYDDLGAAEGHRVAFTESAEAASAYNNAKPLDASNAAILDSVEVDQL